MKYGIVITTYERYNYLLATLNCVFTGLVNISMKIVIVDDCSKDQRVHGLIADFVIAVSKSYPMIEVKVISLKYRHTYKRISGHRLGGYVNVVNLGVNEVKDCEFVVIMQDDILLNIKWLHYVIRIFGEVQKSESKIGAFTLFRDKRSMKDEVKLLIVPGGLDLYAYDYVDGNFCVLMADFLRKVNWNLNREHNVPCSGVFTQLKKDLCRHNYLIAGTKCSFVEHVGEKSEMYSKFNPKITAKNLRMFEYGFE